MPYFFQMLFASFSSLPYPGPEPLRPGRHLRNMCRNADGFSVGSHDEDDVAKLPRFQQAAEIIVQRTFWVVGELKAEHFTAANVIVHCASENVPRFIIKTLCVIF